MSSNSPLALIDTDILSAVMRRHSKVIAHARPYLQVHSRLTFSLMTRYEIMRGLMAKRATTQLQAFNQFCQGSEVLPLTDAIIVRAAEIYGELHQLGQLIGDADILIAATALEHNMMVVTNNETHFRRIRGLQVENWLT